MILVILLAALTLGAGYFLTVLIRSVRAAGIVRLRGEAVGLAAVTNFFDTFGIGSFATTASWLKFRGLVPDRLIPSTMIAAYTLPTLAQSAIFLVLLGVRVDPALLIASIAAVVAGTVLGVGLVGRASTRVVQLTVAFALIAAAVLMAMANLDLMPIGGTATTLSPVLFAVAVAVQFLLGILINFGIGHYAPTLIMLSLMGMDPKLAFPIMASAGAFALIGGGARHIRVTPLDLGLVVGLIVGAVPAVLFAALVVKDLPVETLRWIVVAVTAYAAVRLLQSAARDNDVD